MNTKTVSRFLGLFASALLLQATSTVFAQSRDASSSLITLNRNEVNSSVVKSFGQKFKNATPVNWYKANENNVLVKYSQNTQTQYALFTATGALIRTFTYGTESHLPARIKNLFRDKYWKGTVVNVANVKQDSRDIWIIYCEQDNLPFAIKIEDGEVEEL